MPEPPEELSLRMSVAALTRIARGEGPAIAANARRGFRRKFEDQVDPDRALDHAERARLADAALKAHMRHLRRLRMRDQRLAREAEERLRREAAETVAA